jgi:hydrogenase nickel incorporation protein HypA/HybF
MTVHELAIAESVVGTVTERLPDAKVTCVHLEIGVLSGVVPDSIRFCFDLATEGTAMEGAELEITEQPARCRCRDCGTEFQPEGTILLCPCGSADIAVLGGEELNILSVSVA